MTELALSRLHFPVTTLGPGRRIGIWFQGCSIRCSGCISADTWPAGLGRTSVEAICEAVGPWLALADGITISGGEPFDQSIALQELLTELRTRCEKDILVFTGYAYEALPSWVLEEPALIDGLITDPYDERAPQRLALRGSDNQRLHLLTALGRERFGSCDRPATAGERRFDIMFDVDGVVWLAGIPTREAFAKFQRALASAGHEVVISASRGQERP